MATAGSVNEFSLNFQRRTALYDTAALAASGHVLAASCIAVRHNFDVRHSPRSQTVVTACPSDAEIYFLPDTMLCTSLTPAAVAALLSLMS